MRAVKNQEDEVPQGVDPMEVDTLYGPEDYDDLEPGCECVTLHENGFWGPCFYCQKQGHRVRTCPRKSVGLPRVYAPNDYQLGDECRGYQPNNRPTCDDYDRRWANPNREWRGPSRDEERVNQGSRGKTKDLPNRRKGNWGQRRRVNELGDPATMAVQRDGRSALFGR